MDRPDHSTYREWLNLDVDGLLAGAQRTRLEEHLATCGECRRERAELMALAGLLGRATIEVRPGFRETVMASLPAAGWEARSSRAWRFPAAVFVLLGALAAALMVAGPASSSTGLSALLAVGGMFRAAALAGAGLLAASWKGIGLIVEDVISSPVSLGAFGFLVLCLNLLLISLIRRRRPGAAPAMRNGGTKGGR
ncbi:MAG TPA: zf-HC2 domain-containing protein [Thermoanaerobaculia bacterium]|jgi:anti-sigma factor RsiW